MKRGKTTTGIVYIGGNIYTFAAKVNKRTLYTQLQLFMTRVRY